MSEPDNLTQRLVEGLYCEAIALSDEVRAAFDLSGKIDDARESESAQRIALSCEALRTTTRMMHAIAWLLNHRAFFAGELSDFQLRRHGRLVPDCPSADPDRLDLLEPQVRALIMATERFYARLQRIDRGWRERPLAPPGALLRLRERYGAVAVG